MKKLAALDLALIFPAVLFMAALAISTLPLHETANGAHRLVMWYSGRIWPLWVLLLGLPAVVLITGCAALVRNWIATPHAVRQRLAIVEARPTNVFVAVLTLSAAGILAIVILHMLAN